MAWVIRCIPWPTDQKHLLPDTRWNRVNVRCSTTRNHFQRCILDSLCTCSFSYCSAFFITTLTIRFLSIIVVHRKFMVWKRVLLKRRSVCFQIFNWTKARSMLCRWCNFPYYTCISFTIPICILCICLFFYIQRIKSVTFISQQFMKLFVCVNI